MGYDGINGAGMWAEMGNWYDRHLHNNERSEKSLIGWKGWANYPGEVTTADLTDGVAEDGISTTTFDLARVQKELIPNRVQNAYIKLPALRLWYRTEQEAKGGLAALLSAWNTKDLLTLNDATCGNSTATAEGAEEAEDAGCQTS